MEYKKYSRKEMIKILEKEAILFADTNLGENYIIRQKDIADFIILETERTGHIVQIKFYMPDISEPVATTYGWFLNKINPLLREEIIDRLVSLQTTNKKARKVKIFDNEIFVNLSPTEMGIKDNTPKYFDKFYKKYVVAQEEHNKKRKELYNYGEKYNSSKVRG